MIIVTSVGDIRSETAGFTQVLMSNLSRWYIGIYMDENSYQSAHTSGDIYLASTQERYKCHTHFPGCIGRILCVQIVGRRKEDAYNLIGTDVIGRQHLLQELGTGRENTLAVVFSDAYGSSDSTHFTHDPVLFSGVL
jgi:hypothetical protein